MSKKKKTEKDHCNTHILWRLPVYECDDQRMGMFRGQKVHCIQSLLQYFVFCNVL